MTITKAKKKDLVGSYKTHGSDTGSPEVQVAVLSSRIASLTEHFKTHLKDNHGRRGLIQLVNRRRKLLTYLKINSEQRYRSLIERLNLRK